MNRTLYAMLCGAAIALSGCGHVQAPQTPEQALVQAYGGLGVAAASFNVYAGQRPFCGDANAKPAPLCADRRIVIEGDVLAHQVGDSLEIASQVIKTAGAEDLKWKALTDPLLLLKKFETYVAGVK